MLGLLDAGLLYVVYAAQYAFIFSQKHEHLAAQVQALALDAAMIIFSVLALGLARKGLGAPAERAAIVVCAAASAFMNWTAADQASLRSVAVYVAAPILLALTTDRTISVVRRHVLGMKDDASPWAKLGRGLARLALYTLRAVVDMKGTRRGVKAAILAAAPLPEAEAPALDVDALDGLRAELVATRDAVDTFARSFTGQLGSLRELAEDTAQRQSRLELAAGASAYPTKKAHVLALYRDPRRLWPARCGRSRGQGSGCGGRSPGQHGPRVRVRGTSQAPARGGRQVKIADMVLRGLAWLALGLLRLTWWGLSHPAGDLVALVLVAVLFWRFNLGARGHGAQPGPRDALAGPVPAAARPGVRVPGRAGDPVEPDGRRPPRRPGPARPDLGPAHGGHRGHRLRAAAGPRPVR